MTTFPFPNVYKQTLSYRDAKGNIGRYTFYVSIVGTATANDARTLAININTDLEAITNAAFQSANGPYSALGVAQYGQNNTGGAYESVIEKAVLVYQDSAGSLHRFQIPAPIIGIFLADKVTVNPAQAGVVSLNGLMATGGSAPANQAFVCSRSGAYLANYMGGFYKSGKLRRRSNVFVLTPSLTPSEPEE